MRLRPVGWSRAAWLVLLGCFGSVAVAPAAADDAQDRARAPVALAPSVPTPASARVTAPPPPPPPAVPALAGGGSRGPEYAGALAHRLGLAYQDGGAFVLLSDDVCRVRVYPGSHVISLDGQDQTLRGLMQREVHGVLVPGPAAAIIERHVLESRARSRAAAVAPAPPPAPPKAPPVKVAPPKPVVPVAAPAPGPQQGPVMPDPQWVVASTARDWKWIVLHHSDDHSGCMAKYHQVHLDKGWENGCGYHFVIGNGSQSGDGEIEPSRRWLLQQQGAHAKTPDNHFNDHGIGICLVGDFEHGTGRPTAAQMRALTRLVQWLMDRYEIPVANVRGHCHCGATCCPGKNFPWTELRSRLRDPVRPGLVQAPPAAPSRAAPVALGTRTDGAPGAPRAPAGAPPGGVPSTPALPVTAPAARAHELGLPPAGAVAPVSPR